MKDIFTELYKKVIGVFQKQEEKENNKEVACNRLKLVLMQDRTNLTPHLLERMRGEMIEVLSKYVEMDKEALELNFEAEGESMALMLSIPVVRAKEEEEIQAILKAEEEAKAKLLAAEELEEINETENSDIESEDDEDDETGEVNYETCDCTECEASEELENVEDDEDIEDVEETEAEICDWENPECNDIVASKKKKKKE